MTGKLVHTTAMSWLLDPEEEMLGPVTDGGRIIARTSPGCWGPMITPDYPSGHEVTRPVGVEGARPGDALALEISGLHILSAATTSGTDAPREGRFDGDPFVGGRCPECGATEPGTYVQGTGPESIRCRACDTPVAPFDLPHGYTMLFDSDRRIGVTVPRPLAEEIARSAAAFSALPQESTQHSPNLLAKADLPGLAATVRPMIGNVGSCPSRAFPSSHNAGDFGGFLVDAPHPHAIRAEELQLRTDGHMDINDVTVGSVVIVPVRVEGAGIYVGDVHAMQGDGEIAGHTTDVSAEVTLDVSLLKGVEVPGPLVLARPEDVPREARPLCGAHRETAQRLADRHGFDLEEPCYPVGFVGSGSNLNEATDCALDRIGRMTGLAHDEVRNRCTLRGAVEIGRLPGVVLVTVALPREMLADMGLWEVIRRHYDPS